MPTDPGQITWDPAPQPVAPQQGRQGGVIITDPTVAAEQQRKAEADAREAERLRIAQSGESRAAEGEVRDAAKFKATGGGGTEAQAKASALTSRVIGGFADIQEVIARNPESQEPGVVETLRGGLAPGGVGGIFTREIAEPDRRIVHDAQVDILDALLTLGTGAAYNKEQLESQLTAYFPQYNDTPEEIAVKNRRMRRQIEAAKIAAGPYADDLEAAIAQFMPEAVPPQSPLDTTGQPPADPGVTGAAGAFMTPRDKELQDKLREAYGAGAPLADLQAIAVEYGRPVGLPATQAELDAARAEGRQINVLPSGFREEEVSALGISPESRTGAYAMSAANALLSGGLDEVVGALGGDPAMAQAAKDQMRERYPVASFAGEVTGQALQLAVGAAPVRAIGGGTKALIGAETAQGAAYGAGESNENRALGAAAGAGGALAGRAIADRFVEPGVQAVFQRISRDTGVPVEEVQRVAAEALEPPTSGAVAEPVSDEVVELARQATGSGMNPRTRTARRKLAELAAVDPEAAAAVQRLGVDLPPDVLSENVQLRNLTGLARSQVGSEAETGWQGTAGRAAARVQGVLEEVGATNDLAQLSENVGARITATMDDLGKQANALRAEVDAVISPSAAMDAPALRARMTQTVDELGGSEKAADALNPLERRLMRLIDSEDPPTYAYFERIRRDIGEALDKGRGPFADIDQRTLGEYYAALKSDRLDFVRTVAGDEMADKMAASNALYSQMYEARAELVDLFGKDLQGGIVPRLRTALTTGSKGDIKALNQALSRIPEDMQGDVLLSGIMAESMSKTGAHGGFSFTNFAKLYRGLQNNKPIIAKLGKAVGPERMQILTDLYAVGRRIADAESRVIRTGKANQAQLATINADSFVSHFLKQWGARAAGAGAGAATGTGPLGMATGATIGEALSRMFSSSASRTDQLHRVLSSPQFRDTVERVAEGDTSPGVLNRLANSNAFVTFARATGLDTPESRMAWLKRVATGTGTAGGTAIASETDPQPVIELVP